MSELESRPVRTGFSATLLAMAVLVGGAIGAGAMWMAGGSAGKPAAEASKPGENLPVGVVELTEAAQKNASVEIVTVSEATLPASLDLTGTVAPDEARIARIRPLAKGVVQSVAVRLGDRVTRGQPLATVDHVELGTLVGQYQTEQATLRQTEADVEVKRRALERARELIRLEGIAQQQLDLREAEFKSAEAAVTSQKARVAQAEEQIHRFGITDEQLGRLATSGTHRTESLSVLRAPVTGIVTKYDIAPGELVDSDHELFAIADISTVWVMADVYERDLAKVKAGATVSVRVDAYPERKFIGQLTYVSDIIETQTRTARLRCVVPNQDGALKVDMFARITIPTVESRTTVMVPTRAIQQIDGTPVVFVRESATRFQRRPIKVGTTAGEVVEVVDGVKPGEQIVAGGSFYLKTASLRERIAED